MKIERFILSFQHFRQSANSVLDLGNKHLGLYVTKLRFVYFRLSRSSNSLKWYYDAKWSVTNSTSEKRTIVEDFLSLKCKTVENVTDLKIFEG